MNRAAVVSLLLIHIATRLIERTSSVNYSAPKYRQPMQRLISSELLICRSEFADISSGLVLCVKWKLQSKADLMSLLALIGMKREFWWRRKSFRIKRESQRIISIKGRWMTSSSCDHQLLSHWLLRFQLRHLFFSSAASLAAHAENFIASLCVLASWAPLTMLSYWFLLLREWKAEQSFRAFESKPSCKVEFHRKILHNHDINSPSNFLRWRRVFARKGGAR